MIKSTKVLRGLALVLLVFWMGLLLAGVSQLAKGHDWLGGVLVGTALVDLAACGWYLGHLNKTGRLWDE